MQRYNTFGSDSVFARLKLLGYYAQRTITSRTLRRIGTQATIALLGLVHGQAGRSRQPGLTPVGTMPAAGYMHMGQLLSADQCEDIRAWLGPREMIATRSSGGSFKLENIPTGVRVGDYPLDTVVNCPYIMELANHPVTLGLAAAYLGYTPRITLASLRWSFPSETGASDDVQQFHRDSEPGSIKLMVYLTDVDETSGPHAYVAGTHRDRMPLRLQRYSDAEILRRYRPTVVTGLAGTGFAIDPKGIHKGTPPTRQARLMLVIQYSLLPCLIYENKRAIYRGSACLDPYINGLIIDPS